MPDTRLQEESYEQAVKVLAATKEAAGPRTAPLTIYKSFLKKQRTRLREDHQNGQSGIENAIARSAMTDALLRDVLQHFLEKTDACTKTGETHPVTLVASGGYGRGQLNPGSDIDLQFLVPGSTRGLDECVKEVVNLSSLMLFDLGLEVSYPVRSIREACKFANKDHHTKTTLLDARLIAGDKALFEEFEEAFFEKCIVGQEKGYLAQRSADIRKRHEKFGRTVHLQEPNVKEGCGALRDYHNLTWVIWVLRHSRDLRALQEEKILTAGALKEMREAFDFLMRVRNELHYSQKGRAGNILTLRLQGVVATRLKFPGENILRRSESFMKAYYFHTRNLFQHSTSLMQGFELEVVGDDTSRIPLFNFLGRQSAAEESFDGFVSRDGLIYPESDDTFTEDPKRLMRVFLHIQRRHLRTTPQLRDLFKTHWHLIDGNFRKHRSNRETLEEILQSRGQVAHVFRTMHRLGFLGRYFPEFGQLTDLVQHEFFHRYSADEHTLRCIEVLDSLIHTEDPKMQFFRRTFQDLDDPVAMYIALLLHDTGRAEGVRHHEDASAILASQVCKRLRYTGDRLRLVMFLVDHHLTFWRTATTKDIMDLDTITEFAGAVKNRRWMEALYLFTYVDSNGTNEEAWNDWKASLMQQLYRRTAGYFKDQQKYAREFTRPLARTKEKVIARLPDGYTEEVDAHFEHMARRYFRHRGSTSIARHVKLFRRFFKTFKKASPDSLIPVFAWEARPDEGYSLLEIAGWNRRTLLSKVAGALAARNLNILSADLYTRGDDLVLDVFRVCTSTYNPVTSTREIERIEEMLREHLGESQKNVDFPTMIEKQERPSLIEGEPLNFDIPHRVWTSNDDLDYATVLEIQAQDRMGLLYDIFSVFSQMGVQVINARISTQAGAAIDRFQIVNLSDVKKIEDPERLLEIEGAVADCLRS